MKKAVLFLLVLLGPVACRAKTIYVDADALGANDGSSWGNAYRFLQDALADANSSAKPVEIRVAQGIYKPDEGSGKTPGDRDATFQLINGVALKGGYAGFGQPDPDACNAKLYGSVLCGDLNGDDIDVSEPCDLLAEPTRAENAYHVLTSCETDDSPVLDGFTITGGNANGSYDEEAGSGGAMYCSSGRPNLINCTFTDNSARWGGGAVWCTDSAGPRLTRCIFAENYAWDSGGAVFVGYESWPIISDCAFVHNSARVGGAIEVSHDVWNSEPRVTNCTFNRNSACCGGAVSNSASSYANTFFGECIFNDNSAESDGGAVGSFGIITMVNCIFNRNSACMDGGAFSNKGGGEWTYPFPTLISCTFTGNSASNGGGMYNGNIYGGDWCYPTLISCTFTANAATNGGGICNFELTISELANCIFTANTADYGGAIHNYSIGYGPVAATLTNCTFSRNIARASGGAISNQAASLELTNSILWDDTPDEIAPYYEFYFVEHSDIRGGWPGNGNIDTDPLFADPGYWDPNGTPLDANDDFWVQGDYHLELASPCIDTGADSAIPTSLSTDLEGNPRILGNHVDMGAFEHPGLVKPDVWAVTVPEGGTAGFSVTLTADPGCPLEVTLAVKSGDSDIAVVGGALLAFDSLNYSVPQTVTLAAAEDVDYLNDSASIRLSTPGFQTNSIDATEADNDAAPPILYVDSRSPGANNGMSWYDAFTQLHRALSAARGYAGITEIRVAHGIYKPAEPSGDTEASFQLVAGAAIKGGYAGYAQADPNARDVKLYETVLSGDLNGDDEPRFMNRGDNSSHVVNGYLTDETTVLDGFVIKGGYGDSGGGVYFSKGLITNCTITDNCAGGGGGLYECDGLISFCIITRNSAAGGGGLSQCGGAITNCTITYNKASSGGAIDTCSASITDCNISWNSASSIGGAISYAYGPLTNCLFVGNTAKNGGAIWASPPGGVAVSGCVFRANVAREEGGAVLHDRGGFIYTNCTFSANAARVGGAVYNANASPMFVNCLFAGNSARWVGAMNNSNGGAWPKVIHCTFSENRTDNKGGAIGNHQCRLTLEHSILWNNHATDGPDIYSYDSKIYARFNNTSEYLDGLGNIHTDPCFAEIGCFDPNGTSDDANDDFWVDGDYHLKSQGGRWDANEGRWTIDDVTSPCIDAGDPMSPIGFEPFPNGGRINMGAYGGTAEASKSYFGEPPCETIIAGDINGDCIVDFRDLCIMAVHWCEED